MIITYLRAKNWKNFPLIEVNFQEHTYIIGANASGKSNLLDIFRFLRDICKSSGGGLQKAIADRGNLSKVRCLHSRLDSEVSIEVHIAESIEHADTPLYKYILGFTQQKNGKKQILITEEKVIKNEKLIVNRPNSKDKQDELLLTETHLEQTSTNKEFRDLAEFLSSTVYLHLVPQLLKFGDIIGGNRLADDPFGQGFLELIAETATTTRDRKLKKIGEALNLAVPQFDELAFERDGVGRPHLKARYKHYRPKAGWQTEQQFSDGTLRLIALLWVLLDNHKGILLLEEPELSLHQAIVEQIPVMIQRMQKGKKNKRQILISTHSYELLDNQGIGAESVILLEPVKEGTSARMANEEEISVIEAGFSVAETLLHKTKPTDIANLGL